MCLQSEKEAPYFSFSKPILISYLSQFISYKLILEFKFKHFHNKLYCAEFCLLITLNLIGLIILKSLFKSACIFFRRWRPTWGLRVGSNRTSNEVLQVTGRHTFLKFWINFLNLKTLYNLFLGICGSTFNWNFNWSI